MMNDTVDNVGKVQLPKLRNYMKEKALINNEIQGITFKYQLAKYIQGEQGNIYNFF